MDDDRISELSDYILSDILTTLSIKDLLKTSILSKRWCKLWYLRRNLYFDVFNVLGSSEEDLLQTGYLVDVLNTSYIPPGFKFYGVPTMERLVNLDISRDKFVKRVNQFVMNFRGEVIDSFLVNFCLDDEQSSTINQWISFAIARKVGRIDLLLLGRPYNKPIGLDTQRNPCKFDFGLISKSNASTLNHLRLQNCLVLLPTNCDFAPFKNLRSLSLEQSKLDETLIESLLVNCPRLEEFCLISCEFESSIPEIVSSSLRHLEVIGCYFVSKYDHQMSVNLVLLDCLKLTSLELSFLKLTSSEDGFDTLNFNTPMLKSIKFSIPFNQELNTYVALCATFFPQLEVLHLTTYSMVTSSLKITQPIKHLKELNLFIFVDSDILDDVEYDPLWFLNILQACPLLQKLSIMFTEPEFFENQNDVMRDVETSSHDEIKIIELGGCVGNWFEIEFVMNVLKYARKLERIVMSPYWREDDDVLDCNSNLVWFESGRKRVSEKLQIEEVVGREKLVLI